MGFDSETIEYDAFDAIMVNPGIFKETESPVVEFFEYNNITEGAADSCLDVKAFEQHHAGYDAVSSDFQDLFLVNPVTDETYAVELVVEDYEKDPLKDSNVLDPKENLIEVTTTTKHCIDYQMLPSKIAFFFKMAKFTIVDYIILFYVNAGLSPSEAGFASGLHNFAAMIGAPLWGLLADKFKIHRPLCIILGVLALLTMCVQPFLATFYGRKHVNVCKIKVNRSIELHPALEDEEDINHKTFYYGLLATSIIASSFDSAVMNFVDAGVIKNVMKSQTKCDYGQQRYIGAFGSAVGSISMGLSIRFFPQSNMSCYNGIYITYTFFSILLLITCFYLLKRNSNTPSTETTTTTSTQEDTSYRIRQHLKTMFTNIDTIIFLFDVLFNGVLQALSFNISYLYLQDLNAPTLLYGLSISTCSAISAIVYFLSNRLITLFKGTRNAMCVSCFFWSVRLLVIANLTNPYYILFADLLHGITYSLFSIAFIEHVKNISPPSVVSTMSGFVNGLYYYLSVGIATSVGGTVYQAYGGKVMFYGASIASVCWSGFMFLYIFRKNSKCRIVEQKKSVDASNTQCLIAA